MSKVRIERIVIGVILGLFLVSVFTVANASEAEIDQELDMLEQIFEEQDRELAHTAGPVVNEAPKPFKDSDIQRKLKNGKTQKFDGDKYMIVRRRKYTKKKEVKKAPVKAESHRNRVSVLAGQSPSGNLDCNTTRCRTEREMHLGLQYMRDFNDSTEDGLSVHGLIQVQTNESVYLGIGVGF